MHKNLVRSGGITHLVSYANTLVRVCVCERDTESAFISRAVVYNFFGNTEKQHPLGPTICVLVVKAFFTFFSYGKSWLGLDSTLLVL